MRYSTKVFDPYSFVDNLGFTRWIKTYGKEGQQGRITKEYTLKTCPPEEGDQISTKVVGASPEYVRMSEGQFPVGHVPVAGLPTPLGGAQSPLWWEDSTVVGPNSQFMC
jgi:hypothetical protein